MKLLRLMALVAFLPVAALAAAPMETSQLVDGSGVPFGTPGNPLYVSGGGGGGGGASGPYFVGQYNSTLPSFAAGQAGYLSVDGNGRVIIAPGASVTANLGTLNGAALDTSVQAVKTALGAPFQAGGSIGNTAFGISGTLPAFAATPTFNVGTTGGLALDATLTARLGTLGQKTSTNSAPVVIASDQSALPTTVSNFPATQAVADGADGTGTNPGSGARGWLSGIYARLGGTLTATLAAGSNTIGAVTQAGTWAVNATLQAGSAIIGKVGIDQTTPGTTNGVVVNSSALPTGAATAANQSSEIAALGSTGDSAYAGSGTASTIAALKGLYPRSTNFAEATSASVAGGSTAGGTVRDAGGGAVPWSKFNALATSNQSGTLYIQGSDDNFATGFNVASVALTAGTPVILTVPLLYRYNKAIVINGSTAATISVQSSFTAN